MFSRAGRISAVLLTGFAVLLVYLALDSHDDLAGVVVFFIALYYVAALATVLIVDFVVTALVRSRRAIRRAEAAERNLVDG